MGRVKKDERRDGGGMGCGGCGGAGYGMRVRGGRQGSRLERAVEQTFLMLGIVGVN